MTVDVFCKPIKNSQLIRQKIELCLTLDKSDKFKHMLEQDYLALEEVQEIKKYLNKNSGIFFIFGNYPKI